MTEAERIDRLEMRIAHQDHAIDDLNQMLIAQWKQIDLLTRQLDRLKAQLRGLAEGAAQTGQPEPPPPHY